MTKKFTPSLLALAIMAALASSAQAATPFTGLNANAAKTFVDADLDADGLHDWLDSDIDGDGISNDHEVRLGFDPRNAASTPPDFDGDGLPDALDDDLDGDGVANTQDAFPYDPTEWADMDGDGLGDNTDPDIDGDGISNDDEIQLGFNPRDSNSVPSDIDGDGIPDAFDPDMDGDGVLNEQDAFPQDPKEWADLDGDGVGDNSDPDIDGDGINNEYEVKLSFDPRDRLSSPADQDGDGIPDDLDHDIDGDGVDNNNDRFPRDPKEWADTDGDGIGDNTDPDIDGDGFSNVAEKKAGTDPLDKHSFPDNEPPVLGQVQWTAENTVLTGMVYDDGMGVARVWAQSASGEHCAGEIVYSGHFSITCPQAQNGRWNIMAEDKAGNRQQHAL